MSSDRSQVWWRPCVLGAINGLLFGTTLEVLREAHNNYQGRLTTERFESLGMSPPLAVDMLHWWAIPVWVTAFFIIASFFVDKYLRNRLKPLLVWQIIGVVAVTAWTIFWQLIAWQVGPPEEQ